MNDKTMVYQKANAGEVLLVLGTRVKFLCTGDLTETGFCLLEVELLERNSAPQHHNPWDEADYPLREKVDFKLGD